MPTYSLSHITEHYNHAANPPLLDRLVFTIDHIHQGGPALYSTLDLVRFLTGLQIPVTVFLQCTDPVNLCPAERRNAREIYDLNHNLVSFGAHSLSPGNRQSDQAENLNLTKDVIADVTGLSPVIMSYHGSGAGPENGISYAGIQYARGIGSTWSTAQQDNKLNTPVMGLNSVNTAFEFVRLRNLAGLSATLFVHSNELANGSTKKTVFDTLVKAVTEHKLRAETYLTAMQSDYSAAPVDPVVPTPTPVPPSATCPLDNFTNNRIVQFLRINMRDGVNGSFQVVELQRFLNELGLDAGAADGIFGSRTKLAVIGYQIANNLSADGIVGPNTRASINTICD